MKTKNFIKSIFSGYTGKQFEIEFWDGDKNIFGREDTRRLGTIKFTTEKSLKNFMLHSELGFAESYMLGEITVEGDLSECMSIPYDPSISLFQPTVHDKVQFLLMFLKNRNTLKGSRRNIKSHYDLGNDFYELWLDKNMQYTCAFFDYPEQSLEDAQISKMEYVCRKLELKPGETLLETGSGWGGFAVYAAKNYGVKIKSYNISHEQVEYARQWAARETLEDRIEFLEDDYRNVKGTYDKFASIGMLEHVGKDNYRSFSDLIANHLKDEGLGLIHSITKRHPAPTDLFTDTYIFPGGYIPALSEVIPHLEKNNFIIFDIDNLRLHYARTLHFWRERFEKHREEAEKMFGKQFVRMWQLYLSGAIASFTAGDLTLSQLLIGKGKHIHARLNRKPFLDGKDEGSRWNYWM